MKAAAEFLRDLVENTVQTPGIRWRESYGPGKWMRIEVLGHLIDSAANNHLRFVRALLEPSIDMPGYDQEGCVAVVSPAEFGAERLLNLWAEFNRLIAHVMERIPPGKRDTPCRIGGADPVTLEFLVNDYNEHLRHHLGQILG